jgi:protein tyrosine phosphatase (PTP) superfamily phosphohydrolase (DUF442 family)
MKTAFFSTSLALFLFVAGVPGDGLQAADPAKANEALHVPITRFSQVDARLYRGGQPSDDDFTRLKTLGINTVVSFREDVEKERKLVESLGMKFVHIPISLKPFRLGNAITPKAVARFFEVIDDPASGLVFVHCRRGADRTGTFVGLYRMLRQNWTADRAYDEARDIGMRWWYSYIKDQLEPLSKAVTASKAE